MNILCYKNGYLQHICPKGGFISEPFDWEEDVALKHTFSELVIYKLHIRGFTKQENSGVKHKGTYLGVIEKLSYLKELGINAVLLMPCMEFDEFFEEENGSEGKYAGADSCLPEVPDYSQL